VYIYTIKTIHVHIYTSTYYEVEPHAILFSMEDVCLYQAIVDEIRKEIFEDKLKPGDRIATVRQMAERWNCTIGTVQRAYQELARQGLVISRPGQGTHVIKILPPSGETAIRRASLVHRSESFLLEMLTAGYMLSDVEAAMHQAMEHWMVINQEQPPAEKHTLRFAGSHDPALTWLSAHFPEIIPKFHLSLGFSGSLGGLIALAEGKADLAGAHLWDEQSETYNEPFIRRLLPGKRVALLTFAHRRLGLMLSPGNPLGIKGLLDLAIPGLRFVNRQAGSGTRVWLDATLRKMGLAVEKISGYNNECMTHFEVAAEVAEGKADAGFGLETAAKAYGLDFIYQVRERYDLVIPGGNMELPSIVRLVEWLGSPGARQVILNYWGYDVQETGKLRWVD
jgi:putative molybdopterin biosynthesis protein